MNIDPGKGIYEYEVSFFPFCDSKQMRFKLLNQHREVLGPAKTFDGVTLYLPYQFENTVRYYSSLGKNFLNDCVLKLYCALIGYIISKYASGNKRTC